MVLLTLLGNTLLSVGQCAEASPDSETHLRFVVNTPGAPPYLYFNPEINQYQGIVIDFFKHWPAHDAVTLTLIDSSRARSEDFITSGQGDVMLTSVDWVNQPEQFSASFVIVKHNSYLYANRPFANNFSLQTLPRSIVCTRRSYAYPRLQPYFDAKGLIRSDSSSQKTMFTMLNKNRCDYAIMNEFNAAAIIQSPAFCGASFYQSPQVISSTDLVFVMAKENVSLLNKINQYLKVFISQGGLQRSLDKHAGLQDLTNARDC